METDDIRRSYDILAAAYTARLSDELAHKPFDRAWLERLAAMARGLGPICDLGCGPGQVAGYLRTLGAQVFGADISEEMLKRARERNPGVEFRREDMLALSLPEASLGAVAAFYAIVNLSLDQAEAAFKEIRRALAPGGFLLLAFHIGAERVKVDELFGEKVAMEFSLFEPDEVIARLEAAGLAVEEVTIRYPYKDVEYPSRRAYILARK
jgi:SAM-dependent methyltransferase